MVDIPRQTRQFYVTMMQGLVIPHSTDYVLSDICLIVIEGDCWAFMRYMLYSVPFQLNLFCSNSWIMGI